MIAILLMQTANMKVVVALLKKVVHVKSPLNYLCVLCMYLTLYVILYCKIACGWSLYNTTVLVVLGMGCDRIRSQVTCLSEVLQEHSTCPEALVSKEEISGLSFICHEYGSCCFAQLI